MAGKRLTTAVANPFSTGGGGFSFERLVAATYLVSLVAGDTPRGLDTGTMCEIRFQIRHLGIELDDLLITSKNGSLTQRLALQVKSSALLPPKSSKWKELLAPAWRVWSGASGKNIFQKGRDRLGLAIGNLQAQVEEHLMPVLSWARSSVDSEDFFSKVSAPVYAHKNKRRYVEAIRDALSMLSDNDIEPDTLWQFLRDFVILHFDLRTEGSRDAKISWDKLKEIYGDSQKAFTIFDILMAEAGNKAPLGGTIDRESVEILLIKKTGLAPLKSSADYPEQYLNS